MTKLTNRQTEQTAPRSSGRFAWELLYLIAVAAIFTRPRSLPSLRIWTDRPRAGGGRRVHLGRARGRLLDGGQGLRFFG